MRPDIRRGAWGAADTPGACGAGQGGRSTGRGGGGLARKVQGGGGLAHLEITSASAESVTHIAKVPSEIVKLPVEEQTVVARLVVELPVLALLVAGLPDGALPQSPTTTSVG